MRIFDPDHPDRAAVAAGAPWFMALFGRDSLLTAYMALPIDQQLALGTLQTLARYQGIGENPMTEEQPGRILHEMRFGAEATSGPRRRQRLLRHRRCHPAVRDAARRAVAVGRRPTRRSGSCCPTRTGHWSGWRPYGDR